MLFRGDAMNYAVKMTYKCDRGCADELAGVGSGLSARQGFVRG